MDTVVIQGVEYRPIGAIQGSDITDLIKTGRPRRMHVARPDEKDRDRNVFTWGSVREIPEIESGVTILHEFVSLAQLVVDGEASVPFAVQCGNDHFVSETGELLIDPDHLVAGANVPVLIEADLYAGLPRNY